MSVEIELGEPVVVAQAPAAVRGWGPWQFPSIQRLADGRLVVRYHVEADSATAYGKAPGVSVSADGGASWRAADPEREAPGWSTRIIALPNGDKLRQVMRKSVDPAQVMDRLPPALGEIRGGYNSPQIVFDADRVPEDLSGHRFARLRSGTDQWVEEQATVNIPGALRAIYMGVFTFPWIQRIVPAPDGSLWGVGHGRRAVDGRLPDRHGGQFLRSTDHGRTWDLLGEIPYQPDTAADPHAGERDGFTEPNVAFLDDGSVFCLLRTTDANGPGPMFASRSMDGGRSWSRPEVFDGLGVWPALTRLANGATLAAYGRPGLYVRAALDEAAEEWSPRQAVVPSRAIQQDTCSYSDLLAVTPDKALIAYSDFNYPDADGRPCKTILVRSVGAAASV
jgi:hypothetical protein